MVLNLCLDALCLEVKNIPPSPGKTVDIRRKYLEQLRVVQGLCDDGIITEEQSTEQKESMEAIDILLCTVIVATLILNVNALSIVVSICKLEDSKSLIPLFTLEKAN